MKNSTINTVLITGGTGKIGKVLIRDLYNEGYNVIFTSRSIESILEIENRLNDGKKRNNIFGLQINLEEDNYLNSFLTFFEKKNIFPQALINNARNIEYLKINSNNLTEDESWFGEFRFAVTIPYQLTMNLLNNKNTKLQRVINIASMYGVVAPNLKLYDIPEAQSPINYGTCKAAMIHLSKELAVRLAKNNVLVNTISYGGVEGRVNVEFKNRYNTLTPLGKMLEEDDLYAPVRFLLSEDCKMLTGHNINYDGGWTLW